MTATQQDPTRIAERMRMARRLAGMSQEDAARALDITVRTYARWENGRTLGYLGALDQIAATFGTTAVKLTGADHGDLAAQIAELTDEVRNLRQLILDTLEARS